MARWQLPTFGTGTRVPRTQGGWRALPFPFRGLAERTGARTAQADGGISYVDEGSGALVLAGTGSESHSRAQAATGALIAGGSGTDAHAHASTGTGALALAGDGLEALGTSDLGEGALALAGAGDEQHVRQGLAVGALGLSGEGDEVGSGEGAGTAAVLLIGLALEELHLSDAETGSLTLAGTGDEEYEPGEDTRPPEQPGRRRVMRQRRREPEEDELEPVVYIDGGFGRLVLSGHADEAFDDSAALRDRDEVEALTLVIA